MLEKKNTMAVAGAASTDLGGFCVLIGPGWQFTAIVLPIRTQNTEHIMFCRATDVAAGAENLPKVCFWRPAPGGGVTWRKWRLGCRIQKKKGKKG